MVDKIASNISMVSSGSRTSYYSNYVKKCSLIYLQAGHFFIVQFEKPLVLPTLKDALAKIEELKTSRKKDYFKGIFSKIYEGCYIFEFETTLPASSATPSSFQLQVIKCDADSIAPPCAMKITFHIDMCVVSETEFDMAMGKAERMAECMDKFVSILDDNVVDEHARKRMKIDFENCIVESPLQPISKSKMDEIARTSYIFKRLKEFADSYPQLDVYDNKSAIVYSPQRYFSKYSTSRPDLTALINDVFIFNRDTHESLMVIADGEVEVDVETVEEDATKMGMKMNAMSLRGQCQGVSSFPNIFFSCFIVFLYMSAGCVSTFRSCVQGYLEWLPFVFASHLHFTLC